MAGTQGEPRDEGGCCPGCPHKPASSPNPADKSTPAGKPSAPPKAVCPCADRHATLPSTSTIEQGASGFALFPPPLSVAAPGVGQRATAAGTDLLPPDPTVHVLNCVWLC